MTTTPGPGLRCCRPNAHEDVQQPPLGRGQVDIVVGSCAGRLGAALGLGRGRGDALVVEVDEVVPQADGS